MMTVLIDRLSLTILMTIQAMMEILCLHALI